MLKKSRLRYNTRGWRKDNDKVHIADAKHVEEANMKDDKVDIDSVEAIAFDPYTHGYYKDGTRVGDALKEGLKLK